MTTQANESENTQDDPLMILVIKFNLANIID